MGDASLISVSKKPIDFGSNIVLNIPPHHINIYRAALTGIKAAKTKYIAIAEDDTLYSPEHFKCRPKTRAFAYNLSCWGFYTWIKPPIFSHRFLGRRNHSMLICERDLYIEAMEERFAKYPTNDMVNVNDWAEPGKYEGNLKLTQQPFETFYTNPPNIMFSHDEGLSHLTLGHKKRLGELRALELPYWGKASDIMSLYEKQN